MDNKQKLLNAALELAPFEGWCGAMLAHAARNADLAEQEVYRLFPKGSADIIAYYIEQTDSAMTLHMQTDEIRALRLPQRIREAVLFRLRHSIPHREAIRRALAFFYLPQNYGKSIKTLYTTVDAIWHAAGDSSVDFSFYTKRLTLAAIYSTTLIIWLDDISENQSDTAAFLDRRLNDVAAFGKFKASISPFKKATTAKRSA